MRSHMEAAARELARQSQRELVREYGEMRAASQAMPDAWPDTRSDAHGPDDVFNPAPEPGLAEPGLGLGPHPRSAAAETAGRDAGAPEQAAPLEPGAPDGSLAIDMEDWGDGGGPAGLRGGPLGWRQATSAVWDGGGGGSGAAYTPQTDGAWRRMGGRRLDLDNLQNSPMGGTAEQPARAPGAASPQYGQAGGGLDFVPGSPMEGVEPTSAAEQPAHPGASRAAAEGDAGEEERPAEAPCEGGARIPQADGAGDSDGERDAAALGVQIDAVARQRDPGMSPGSVPARAYGRAEGAAGRGWVVPRACSAAGPGAAVGAAAGSGAPGAAAAHGSSQAAIAADEPGIKRCPAAGDGVPGAAALHQGSAAAGAGCGRDRAPVALQAGPAQGAPWAGSVLDLPPLDLTRAEAARFVRRTAQLSAAVRAALALSTSSSNEDAPLLGPNADICPDPHRNSEPHASAAAHRAPDLRAGQAAWNSGSSLAPAAMAAGEPVLQVAAAGEGPGSGVRGAVRSPGMSPPSVNAADASIPTTQEEPEPAEAVTMMAGQAAAACGVLPPFWHASTTGAAAAVGCSQGLGMARAQGAGAHSLVSRSPAAPVAHRVPGGSPDSGWGRNEGTGHDSMGSKSPAAPAGHNDAEAELVVSAPLVRLNLTLSPSTEASAYAGGHAAGIASPSVAPAAAPGPAGAGPVLNRPETAVPSVAAEGSGADGSQAASAGGIPQVPRQPPKPLSRGSDQASQGAPGTQGNCEGASQDAGHAAGPGAVPDPPLQLHVAPPPQPAQAAPSLSACPNTGGEGPEQHCKAGMVAGPDGANHGSKQSPGTGAFAPDPISGYGVVGDPWQGAGARPDGWESDSGSFGDALPGGGAPGRHSGDAVSSPGRRLVPYRYRKLPPSQV